MLEFFGSDEKLDKAGIVRNAALIQVSQTFYCLRLKPAKSTDLTVT